MSISGASNIRIPPSCRKIVKIPVTITFAPRTIDGAIERQLQVIGPIFGAKDASAVSVAEAMIAFAKSINAPTKLGDVKGFTEARITRTLAAAKDPQLEMKLQNMPIPMTSADVDTYMAPLLRAATEGDLTKIKAM
ncbi:MAG: iron-containing alcohol dehydrogenase [Spirochaetales bacterium]|nr:iron-containing alcohol dehydrogenase [Spirochaetales bacterium]